MTVVSNVCIAVAFAAIPDKSMASNPACNEVTSEAVDVKRSESWLTFTVNEEIASALAAIPDKSIEPKSADS